MRALKAQLVSDGRGNIADAVRKNDPPVFRLSFSKKPNASGSVGMGSHEVQTETHEHDVVRIRGQ